MAIEERNESPYCTGNPVCDTLRFLCDASYAVMPRDVAHRVGEMKKNLLGGLRWLVDKRIEWEDERIAGGDRLREEWRRGSHESATTTGGGI